MSADNEQPQAWRELGLPGPPPNGEQRLRQTLTWFADVLFIAVRRTSENQDLLRDLQANGCQRLPAMREEMRREYRRALFGGLIIGALAGGGGAAGVLELVKSLL